jgi:hypothetical protein
MTVSAISRSPRATRWIAAGVGVALVTAAWFVALVTPTEDDAVIPFTVQMQPGEQASGRNLGVTLVEVRRAASATTAEWSADGNWVIVDLEALAIQEEFGSALVLATLRIDGVTYQASERPESLFEQSLAVGIPKTGSLAFELPESVNGGTAVLSLGMSSDTRLDSLLEYSFDLGAIEVASDGELIPTGWSAP